MSTDKTLDQYIQPLLAHKKLIVVVAVLTLIVGTVAGLAAPTTYRSTASILVTPISGDPTKALESGDIKVDMPTELRIATSQAVIDQAAEQLADQSINVSSDTLANSISATNPKDSRILDFAFEAPTPELAQAGADAFAQTYLAYRAQLANANREAAQESINERISLVKDRLSEIESGLARSAAGSQNFVNFTVEKASVTGELVALQTALADLSTLTIDAGEIVDQARLPEAPEGLNTLQIIVGSLIAGIVLGTLAAYLFSAWRWSRRRDRRASDPAGGPERRQGTAADRRPQPSPDEPAAQVTDNPASPDQATVDEAPAKSPASTNQDQTSEPPQKTADPAVESTPGEVPEEMPASLAGPKSTNGNTPATNGNTPATNGSAPASNGAAKAAVPLPAPVDEQEPETEPRPKTIVVDSGFDELLDKLRKLGAAGPVTALCLGDFQVAALSVAFDLADALQRLGAKILLIDVAIEQPLLDSLLGVSVKPGLADVLAGRKELTETVRAVEGLEGLDSLTIGEVDPFTDDALQGQAFETLLSEAKTRYHAVLLVAGRAEASPKLHTIAEQADGLVVGSEQLPGTSIEVELHGILEQIPAPTLAVVSAEYVPGRSRIVTAGT